MKRLPYALLASLLVLLGSWGSANAVSVFIVPQGGTGTTTAPAGQILYGGGAGVYQSVATGTVAGGTNISVTAGQSVIGSGLTIGITGQIGVGNGGTGVGSFTAGQILYGNGTNALSSVATSSLAVNGSITSSGTLGAQVGGSATTLSLNMGNANTWTALQTFANSSTTLASFGYASSTVWRGGGLVTDCDNGVTSKLLWDTTTGQFSCGTDQTTGSSFAWPWTTVNVYGVDNQSTTSPMQFQGAINASSTVRIKTNILSVNAIGFFDLQRDAQTAGNGYTLARIKAPTGASEEATLSLLIDFDQNNAGVNERFVDIYSEHYSDSNQAGIRIFQTGSATLPNSFMFGWKLEAGSKDSQNVGGFFPNGGWLIGGPATTTATASTVLTVSSTTATNLLDVKAGNNASRLMVLGTGNVGIGTTTPNARLNVVNNSSGMVGRFASNVPSSTLMFSIERQNGSGVMTGATRFGFLNNNSDIAARNGLNFYVNNTADLDANANGTNALSILSSGNVGVGTTTPFAKFAISLNSTDAAYPGKNAFIISSSTNAATTTLFSISNIGTINIATTTSGCVQSTTAGLLWIGSCSGSGGTPGGSATELQYRSGASTFGAVSSAYDSARSSLAIGTTTFTTNPGVLTLGTSTNKTGSPLLSLSGGAGVAGWGLFNQGGIFTLATTSDTTGATTTLQSVFTATANGSLGLATNTPQSMFSIGVLGGILTHALGFPDGTYKDSNGIMIVKDEKTVNTAGGSSVAGTQVRTLNTVTVNTIVGASLSSNQVTLPAGTYTVRACAPAFISDKHKVIWFNVTDTATTTQGSSAYDDSTTNVVQTDACLDGYFTITASKTYELRHYIQVARATNGLGVFMGQSTEVYARVTIEKR